MCNSSRERSAAALIKNEIAFARKEAKAKFSKLRHATKLQAGLEILHIFILDLLGRDTNAAKIFISKTEEDFRHSFLVSRSAKYATWAVIVLLNLFFVYFSLLRGLERGLHWQRMFLVAAIIEIFVEVFIFETSECIIVQYFIPNIVSHDVQNVSAKLREVIEKTCDIGFDDTRQHSKTTILDAAKYLFVSNQLVMKFPDLIESALVRSYISKSPGELGKRWKFSHHDPDLHVSKRYNTFLSVRFGITVAFINSVQFLGAQSQVLQRLVIHSLQPIVVAAMFLVVAFMWNYPISFTPFVIATVYLIYLKCKRHSVQSYRRKRSAEITPHRQSLRSIKSSSTPPEDEAGGFFLYFNYSNSVKSDITDEDNIMNLPSNSRDDSDSKFPSGEKASGMLMMAPQVSIRVASFESAGGEEDQEDVNAAGILRCRAIDEMSSLRSFDFSNGPQLDSSLVLDSIDTTDDELRGDPNDIYHRVQRCDMVPLESINGSRNFEGVGGMVRWDATDALSKGGNDRSPSSSLLGGDSDGPGVSLRLYAALSNEVILDESEDANNMERAYKHLFEEAWGSDIESYVNLDGTEATGRDTRNGGKIEDFLCMSSSSDEGDVRVRRVDCKPNSAVRFAEDAQK